MRDSERELCLASCPAGYILHHNQPSFHSYQVPGVSRGDPLYKGAGDLPPGGGDLKWAKIISKSIFSKFKKPPKEPGFNPPLSEGGGADRGEGGGGVRREIKKAPPGGWCEESGLNKKSLVTPP